MATFTRRLLKQGVVSKSGALSLLSLTLLQLYCLGASCTIYSAHRAAILITSSCSGQFPGLPFNDRHSQRFKRNREYCSNYYS
jgi:hypothetical protein